MNQSQAETALAHARKIETINFDEAIVKRLYPERKDLDTLMISQMYVYELFAYSKKVFQQFITELQERENYLPLPYSYNHPVNGNSTLENQMAAYFNHIANAEVAAAESSLVWLLGYQVEYGIFHKNSKRTGDITSTRLLDLSEKLSLERMNLENLAKDIKKVYDKLAKTNDDIQAFSAQKREELNSIATNLSTSTTQTNQINDLLNRSTDSNSKLTAILQQQEENKRQSDTKLATLEADYSSTIKVFADKIKEAEDNVQDFKKQSEQHREHLTYVEGKRSFFEERITYLESLIGREVGASLFETFKQRKTELQKPVIFWRWAVPAMSLATIGWIFFLFYNQPHDGGANVWWEAFAVNTLKSIPAIFLLLFAINQYRKERNFQEEYAFKSAVALTIDAYAGRLQDVVNKDKLIMEAVLGVYKTPIEERQQAKIKNKTLLDTFKTVTETSKELIKNTR
jgi:hypothetical protein